MGSGERKEYGHLHVQPLIISLVEIRSWGRNLLGKGEKDMGSLRANIRKYELERKLRLKGRSGLTSGVYGARVHSSAVAEPKNLSLSSYEMSARARRLDPDGWLRQPLWVRHWLALGLRQTDQRETLHEMTKCVMLLV